MILFITVIVYHVTHSSRNSVNFVKLENKLKNINSLRPGSVSDLNDDQVPTYLPNSPET